MMTENKNVELTNDESQTYLHLGIIAANAGYGESIYRTRKQIAEGKRDLSGKDLIAWYGQQFTGDELDELYCFRNSLLHGVAMVHPNGDVVIFDRNSSQRTYTSDEIRKYASRFWGLRFENRVTMTVSAYSVCHKCGAEFLQPEGIKELEEHLKSCALI